MDQSSTAIVGDVPAVNVRHSMGYSGEWNVMASRYEPTDRYPAEHIDITAYAFPADSRVSMSMSLPTAVMQALYNALGVVLAKEDRPYVPCSMCGLRNYETTDPTWHCPDYPTCGEQAGS